MRQNVRISRWLVLGLVLPTLLYGRGNLVGVGVTLHKKILINFAFQRSLSASSWLRLRVYLAANGKPAAFGLHVFQADKTGTSWQPFLGAGVEVLPHRFHQRMHWTPYGVAALGVAYRPHAHLMDEAQFTVGYFPRLGRLFPLGLSLWHLNSLR